MADEKQIEPVEPDWDDDFEGEENDTPDYYYCYGCLYSTVTDHGGWGCPRCGAVMSPEYY